MRFIDRRSATVIVGMLATLAAAVHVAGQPEDLSSSLVRIDVTATGQQGSGIIVGLEGDDAIVLTAFHVIAGAPRFSVTLAGVSGGRRFDVDTESDRIGWQNMDKTYGLAAFRVRNVHRQDVRMAPLGSSSELRPGDGLLYLGFPGRLRTVQRLSGSVSALDGTFIVMDRSIGEGASGGAIVKDGRVVAIAANNAADLTYAVGVDVARLALRGWGVDVGSDQPEPSLISLDQRPGTIRLTMGLVFQLVNPNQPLGRVRMILDEQEIGSLEGDARRGGKTIQVNTTPGEHFLSALLEDRQTGRWLATRSVRFSVSQSSTLSIAPTLGDVRNEPRILFTINSPR